LYVQASYCPAQPGGTATGCSRASTLWPPSPSLAAAAAAACSLSRLLRSDWPRTLEELEQARRW